MGAKGVNSMAFQLCKHKAWAYAAAAAMLDCYGKAAIVYPTGTGKSYIAFKLIEDHPDAAVLWLSLSEYIFQTQVESLRRQDSDFQPVNVCFYAYAKLMFCAQELLCLCADAGVSGINIRYLDNNRDMAEELFDGHVATEMTRDEAIVRGILPTTKYVTTYSGIKTNWQSTRPMWTACAARACRT